MENTAHDASQPLWTRLREGDALFLAGPTERPREVWGRVSAVIPEERRRLIFDADATTPSSITSHAPWLS
ncbi:MAG: hypothetical protein ACJ72W_20825 [Actinoallomurus sp.]